MLQSRTHNVAAIFSVLSQVNIHTNFAEWRWCPWRHRSGNTEIWIHTYGIWARLLQYLWHWSPMFTFGTSFSLFGPLHSIQLDPSSASRRMTLTGFPESPHGTTDATLKGHFLQLHHFPWYFGTYTWVNTYFWLYLVQCKGVLCYGSCRPLVSEASDEGCGVN